MIWRRQNADAPDISVVKFIPQGGFNKKGSFVEGRNKSEYEIQGFITVDILCSSMEYRRRWGLEDFHNDKGTLEEFERQSLASDGVIQPAEFGQFSFSFLGHQREHKTVGVTIHRASKKAIFFVPMKGTGTGDIDFSWDERFNFEVRLDEESFDVLRSELRNNPDFDLMLSVELDHAKGLYTTWSPSVSEGRVLKVLDNRADVTNGDELPEDFDAERSTRKPMAFTIAIGHFEKPDAEVEGL